MPRGRGRAARSKGTGSGPRRTRRGANRVVRSRPDPSDTTDAETRFVQPFEASKAYLCPGCNREIPPGLGHMVVVPRDEPDLRRHWHRGCWINRTNRY